jgi:hypothetical protein
VWLRNYLTLILTSWYSKYSIKRIVRFNAGKCLNFIIFGRQKLTTLKGRLLRPNFDTMIKENTSTYNRNNVCNFTEKINTSDLITFFNHSKSHRKCSCCGTPVFATFFFVWFVFCLKMLCAEEFEYTKGNTHRSRKHNSMAYSCLSFLFCPIGICPSINRLWFPLSYFQTLLVIYLRIK